MSSQMQSREESSQILAMNLEAMMESRSDRERKALDRRIEVIRFLNLALAVGSFSTILVGVALVPAGETGVSTALMINGGIAAVLFLACFFFLRPGAGYQRTRLITYLSLAILVGVAFTPQ